MTVMSLSPMLTVKDAGAAAQFYASAFGAVEHERFVAPTGQYVIAMTIEEHRFFVVDENPSAFNLSPASLGGTTVRLNLIVSEPDDLMRQALSAGATEVFPMGDQPYGLRQGRVADPEGHHWLIGKPLEHDQDT